MVAAMADSTDAVQTEKPRYHHGDLRGALMRAAEQELLERGIEAFSLRSVAKRAGVSHAAPAHHFGDAKGLLTALTAEGFRRFLAMQHAREAAAAPDARSQILAAGLGYIDFALGSPALYRLMFSSKRPDFQSEELDLAARAAYRHLVDQVAAVGGDVRQDGVPSVDVAAAWVAAHGLADLILSRPMAGINALPQAERDAFFAAVIGRALPG
jgi:AcrR family transcriptional regulator